MAQLGHRVGLGGAARARSRSAEDLAVAAPLGLSVVRVLVVDGV